MKGTKDNMLPDVRRLNREDFQDAPSWIDPMLNTLNAFMDSVYNIFNRNVSLIDNLNMQIITLSVSTKSDGSINPIEQKLAIRGKVNGVVVLKVISEDIANITTPFLNWTQSSDILEISNIASLNNNKDYKIIILVIGE